MPQIDLPLDELYQYKPPRTAQADFDSYWETTLSQLSNQPLNESLEEIAYPIAGYRFYQIFYDGWRGSRICGWYLVPEGTGPFPVMVVYHGYGCGKGSFYDLLPYAAAGFAVLAVDTRGQTGGSSNPGPYSDGHIAGYMTMGIMNPEEYYYRGAIADCVKALDFVSSRPELDNSRIALTGASQGGGLTLAVAALDDRPKVAVGRVPFLCHYKRALQVSDKHPYWEIARYLNRFPDYEEQAFITLSYCDNLNLSCRIKCPTLVTVGLQDLICPPSTIFATYNHMTCQKKILTYPYMEHHDNDAQWEHVFGWLQKHL